MRGAIAGFAVAVLVAAPAAAAPAAKGWESPTYSACMDRSGGVTLSMRECTVAELERRDAELNSTYRRFADLLTSPERKAALRTAQRAWIAFRDAECEAEASDVIGGSLWPIVVETCHVDMTYDRTLQLREQAKTANGN